MDIFGNDFGNTLTGTLGDDHIDAKGGNDTIIGSQGMDVIDGGAGSDTLVINVGNASRFTLPSGSRSYVFTPTAATDSSLVLNSSISSIERINFSALGAGDFGDSLDAGALTSATVLLARMGNGNDTVIGGAADDFIFTGLGINTVDAGGGTNDNVIVQTISDAGEWVYVTSSAGAVITTENGIQTNSVVNGEKVIFDGLVNGSATRVDASAYTPIAGVQLVFNDVRGSETYIGSSGDDRFAIGGGGQPGVDTFTGGAGADYFDYSFAADSINGDTITDFDALDTLDFTGNDGNTFPTLCTTFIGAAAFHGIAGEYRYQVGGGQTLLQVDSNGDGVADQVLTLANGEFGLVETAPGSNILVRAGIINGTSGPNTLIGTLGNDVINAFDGNDSIRASQGTDVIDGGVGSDTLVVNTFSAALMAPATGSRTYTVTERGISDSSGTLHTSFSGIETVSLRTFGNGDFGDTIDASALTTVRFVGLLGSGHNSVTAGAVTDLVLSGRGVNIIDMGEGAADNDNVVIEGDSASGGTIYLTRSGSTVLTTENGIQTNAIVNSERITFQGYFEGATTVVDASGFVPLAGTQLFFNDLMGSETFIGSSGNDYFGIATFGVAGTDIFTGGGGADRYDYTYAVDGLGGDTITDFSSDDVIDLAFNDGNPDTAGLLCTTFIGAAAFHGIAGEYRYQVGGGQTLLQVDTNGDTIADQVLTLTNGEFGLVETAPGSNALVRAEIINGSGLQDTLTGTLGNDIINALGSRDTINATQGHDFVDGGNNLSDRLIVTLSDSSRFATPATGSRTYILDNGHLSEATSGLDTGFVNVERVTLELSGTGDFGDTVNSSGFGAAIALDIRLGNGNDTVIGGSANESIYTRLGINTVDAGGGSDSVSTQMNLSLGTTMLVTGSGNLVTTIQNGVTTNTILNAEFVGVGANVDALFVVDGLTYTVDASGYTGSAAIGFNDHNGNDIFIGSAGTDFFGNLFNATVGDDTYTGNGGADWYDYTVAINALNHDVITDFDADDTIDFQYNDGSFGATLLCNSWIGAAAFSGIAGQYRYTVSGADTLIQIDTDGDSVADHVLTLANSSYVIGETSAGSNQLHVVGQVVTGTGGGDPALSSTSGDDVVNALGGNDLIYGSIGHDSINGGPGTDRLVFLLFDTAKFGVIAGPSTYTVTANHVGNSSGSIDTAYTSIERVNIYTAGSGDFNDSFDLSGFVTNPGLGVVVVLTLGNGNDTVVGSNFDDEVYTGAGINSVNALGGYDRIHTHDDFSTGATQFVSGSGNQVLTTLNGVTTNSIVNAEMVFVGADLKFPLPADGLTHTVNASAYTGTAQLFFVDHNGADVFVGSAGADFFSNLKGFTAGGDTYTGGGGADTFDYTVAAGAMNGDRITDFGFDDIIDLRSNAAADNSGALATHYIGFAYFTGVAGEYRYQLSGGNTLVQIDSDGDKVADQTLTLNGSFFLQETAPGSNMLKAIVPTVGTNGPDVLTGTAGWDALIGLDGNDTFTATGGRDFVVGGNGNDRLVVTMSDASFAPATGARSYFILSDTVADVGLNVFTAIFGVERVTLTTTGTGDHNDSFDASYFVTTSGGVTINSGNGSDTILGSSYNDSFSAGLGNNVINGGAGYDFALVKIDGAIAGPIQVTNVGGALVTTQNGVQTNVLTNMEEVLLTGVGAGTITIDASGYVAIPGLTLGLGDHNGNDIVIGSTGNDFFANFANNSLGSDVFTGNGGADIFDFAAASNALNGDVITDFDGDDTIDLSGNNGPQLGGSPLLANLFIGANAFHNVAGEYRYQISGTQTFLQLDTDGNGVADQVLTIANGAFALVETSAGSNILKLAAPIDPVEGVVADGYVEGATLFLDTNGNGLLDDGEASTVTGPGGAFSFKSNQVGTIVAVGGTNSDTGLANQMRLMAPSSAAVVNPITTVIAAVMAAAGVSAAAAETLVGNALGLNPAIDLLNYDPLCHPGDAQALLVQKQAAMVANLVTTAETIPGAGAAAEAQTVQSLAELLVNTAAGAVVDLTNAATIGAILTDALPGVAGTSAAASQIATEGDAIEAATSLAGVSNAQLNAQLADDNANVLTGTDEANWLSGLGGNDTLYGLGGNDILDGGLGNDLMVGGLGNDLYVVDAAGDGVSELSGQGYDTVRSSISYTLGANVEALELTGTALNGTGNGLDNLLTGDALSNLLSGGGGNDRLIGGDGLDSLRGGSGNDTFVAQLDSHPIMTKSGPLSIDVVLDFAHGDLLDLTGIDANSVIPGLQDFTWIGTNSNKSAGAVSMKVYDSVGGAENALGVDLDGVAGKSPYSGPVTMVYGNHDGGVPDFAIALFGVNGITPADLVLHH